MNISRVTTLFLVGLLAITAVAGPAAAQSVETHTAINPDADATANPYIETDVTISPYDRETMSGLQYEDNNGEVATLPADIDRSEDVADLGTGDVNVWKFTATDVDFKDAGAFPVSTENVSLVENASKWTTDESSTAGIISVSSTTTAPGVEAVEVSTSSQTSGDTATATFADSVDITSDANKRYLQFAADVSTLDSGANVEVRAVDSDGDYVAANVSDFAGSTGEGYVFSKQVGSMTVMGSGDGSMGEIQSVEIAVSDGDATMSISAFNAAKTSQWQWGDERVDDDSDDNLETETILENADGGDITISELATMGSAFETAEIHGLTVPAKFAAADLPSEVDRVNVTFEQADNYPNYEWKQTARYRFELPSAYDVSYANSELKEEIDQPEGRYQSVEYLEGASDTNFSELSGWSDVTSSVAAGETVTYDSSLTAGQKIAFRSVSLQTDAEKENVLDVSAAVGGLVGGGSGGGLFSGINGIITAIVSGIGGYVALARGWLGGS